MKYTAKLPPEVNVTPVHPLKELLVLVGGVLGIGLALVLVLALMADRLITLIPLQYENSTLAGLFSLEHSDAYPKTEAYLNGLVQSLRPHYLADNRDEYVFHVSVTPDKEPNAFVTPGGRISVTTGLLRMLQTENGLAMVLGHEMGHQYRRHPIRGLGRGAVMALALLVMSGLDGSQWASRVISDTAMLGNLAFSRSQEAEADAIGERLLLAAYGHAAGASEFFRLLQESGHNEPWEFLSSHPSTEHRLAMLVQHETQRPGQITPLPAFIHTEIRAAAEAAEN
jgi:predicted Zn-dependent protease